VNIRRGSQNRRTHLPRQKERRAWIEFELYLLANIGARNIAATPSKRGRPSTFEGRAIAAVAKQVGISERTAREWFDRFFPNGYA
jgi:hypothetical protein